MVLQAKKTVRIFGTGKGKVSVEINGVYREMISEKEDWLVELPAQDYGGPYILKVNLNSEEKVFEDVWFGDVFLMGGQSNMRYNIDVSPLEEKDYAQSDNLRIFGVSETDAAGFTFDEGWSPLTKNNAGRWSAIAYYMGLALEKREDKKYGFILCGIGASVIQSYLPKGTFDGTECEIPYEERCHDIERVTVYANREIEIQWKFGCDFSQCKGA